MAQQRVNLNLLNWLKNLALTLFTTPFTKWLAMKLVTVRHLKDFSTVILNNFKFKEESTRLLLFLYYQIAKDKARLAEVNNKLEHQETKYEINNDVDMMVHDIESTGKKTLIGNRTLSADEYDKVTTLAKNSYVAQSELKMLREENRKLRSRIWDLEVHIERLEEQLRKLTELCKPYLDALKAAPKKVKEFIDSILEPFRRQRDEQAERLQHKPISKNKDKTK